MTLQITANPRRQSAFGITANTRRSASVGSRVSWESVYGAPAALEFLIENEAEPDQFPNTDNSGAWQYSDITDYARTLIDDASAEAARDTLEFDDTTIDATMIGLVGDGTTDNSTALQAWLDGLGVYGGKIRFGAGKYRFNSPITHTLPNVASGLQDTDAFAAITMEGAGQDVTILYFPSGDGFIYEFESQQHAIHWRDFSITTGDTNSGAALTITNGYDYFGTHCAQSTIKNVTFRGDDGYALTKYWSEGFDISDCTNFAFDACNFKGASTPAGTGGRVQASNGSSYATNFQFNKCTFEFLALGFRYGLRTQNVNFVNCFFAQNSTDCHVPASGGHLQGLAFIGCVFYCAAAGDRIYTETGVPDFIFIGNSMSVHEGYRGIAMDASENFTITGNTFFPNLTANMATAAIDINGSASGMVGLIDDNTFRSTTIGARLLGTSEGVTFGAGNAATSGMTLVTDAGTGNTIPTGTGSQVKATSPTFTTSALFSSGFVMSWNSGDVTLTHAANTLTMAGGKMVINEANALLLGAASTSISARLVIAGGSDRNSAFGLEADGPLFSALNDANNAYVPNYTDASQHNFRQGPIVATLGIRSTGATAGIGYNTGAGGAQTQGTSKSTAVTLDKVCGQITMHNATLNAGASVGFTLNNSAISTTDVVAVCIDSAATADSYNVTVDAVGAGSCRISLHNKTAGNLGEAVVLNFAVIKAVAA